MKRQLLMLSVLLLLSARTTVAKAETSSESPAKVDVSHLLAHKDKYLGKTILVHACFFDTVIEGAILFPCGKRPWKNNALILEIPDSKAGLVGDVYRRLHLYFSAEIEADVVGLLTRDTINTQSGKHTLVVLRLQDVLHPKTFRKLGH